MVVRSNPIELKGPWNKGYALDKQVLHSELIGRNEYGYPEFYTIRTKIGEALYQLKYRDNDEHLKDIIDTASAFIRTNYLKQGSIDDIIGINPSYDHRKKQPVKIICEGLSESLRLHYTEEYIRKVKHTPQMKNTDVEDREGILLDAFKIVSEEYIKSKQSVLIIDDLFQTGTTLRVITDLIKSVNSSLVVYVLAMTKTKG